MSELEDRAIAVKVIDAARALNTALGEAALRGLTVEVSTYEYERLGSPAVTFVACGVSRRTVIANTA